ncbi:MAG: hypothetical protein MHMPM18_004841, partial [Marteilia pararefringens]
MGIYENNIPDKNSSKSLSNLFCPKKPSEKVSPGDAQPIHTIKKWKTKKKKPNDTLGTINGVTEGIYENQMPDEDSPRGKSNLLNSKKHSRNVSMGDLQLISPTKKSKDKKKAPNNNLGTGEIGFNRMRDKSTSMSLLKFFDQKKDSEAKMKRSTTITKKDKGFLKKRKDFFKSKFAKEKTSDCLEKNLEEIHT